MRQEDVQCHYRNIYPAMLDMCAWGDGGQAHDEDGKAPRPSAGPVRQLHPAARSPRRGRY
ncbi:protein of unknown function [Denitratisoma oestradiolicum]|uniref:Uncharacterized protein n=1 Tax=Denitratisoma oestradiolicum TaxID=311182 RepID=A0A6S6YIJ7_9PROT|nr:protein of unknown function [Denitratisoma oestradiolicum]